MKVNEYDGVVDGLAQCGGGPSCDRIKLFDAFVDWVERGMEHDSESESDYSLQMINA